MTHEERLEVFEDNIGFAESFAVQNKQSGITYEEAKCAALRALWRSVGFTKKKQINTDFLKKEIKMEMLAERKGLASHSQARSYWRVKKLGKDDNAHRYGHASALAKYSFIPEECIDYESGPRHYDERSIGFEMLPEEIPEDIVEIIEKRLSGYGFNEIGEGKRSSAWMKLRRYLDRNKHKFDLTLYENPVQSY